MEEAMRWLAAKKVPVSDVVDIGAAVGHWSTMARHHFPTAQFHMLEAQSVHFRQLESTARKIGGKVYKCAVGGVDGFSDFDVSSPFGGSLAVDAVAKINVARVPVRTLDTAIGDVSGPLLLKFDTHGGEREILSGATRSLERTSAILMECYNFEINSKAETFDRMITYLRSLAFVPVRICDLMARPIDQALWQMDVLLVHNDYLPSASDIRYSLL